MSATSTTEVPHSILQSILLLTVRTYRDMNQREESDVENAHVVQPELSDGDQVRDLALAIDKKEEKQCAEYIL